jgi:hypothetical protein
MCNLASLLALRNSEMRGIFIYMNIRLCHGGMANDASASYVKMVDIDWVRDRDFRG